MKNVKRIQWTFPMRLYILARTDLPSMNPGKAMAQVAHAANQFVHQFGDLPQVKFWQQESKMGFGTTIVLGVDGKTLEDRVAIATKHFKNVPSGLVYDDTYPFYVSQEIYSLIDRQVITAPCIVKEETKSVIAFRKELTCGFIFVGADSSDKDELVGDLSLHP